MSAFSLQTPMPIFFLVLSFSLLALVSIFFFFVGVLITSINVIKLSKMFFCWCWLSHCRHWCQKIVENIFCVSFLVVCNGVFIGKVFFFLAFSLSALLGYKYHPWWNISIEKTERKRWVFFQNVVEMKERERVGKNI